MWEEALNKCSDICTRLMLTCVKKGHKLKFLTRLLPVTVYSMHVKGPVTSSSETSQVPQCSPNSITNVDSL